MAWLDSRLGWLDFYLFFVCLNEGNLLTCFHSLQNFFWKSKFDWLYVGWDNEWLLPLKISCRFMNCFWFASLSPWKISRWLPIIFLFTKNKFISLSNIVKIEKRKYDISKYRQINERINLSNFIRIEMWLCSFILIFQLEM